MRRSLDAGRGFQPWALARDVAQEGRTEGAIPPWRRGAPLGGRWVGQDGWGDGWAVWGLRALVRQLACAYFQLDVQGLDRIPREGGAVIAGNHPSVLDGILLWAVSPRPVRFLIAEDLYNHRYLNPLFRAFGCIQVYRTKTNNGDALRAAVTALDRGELLGIFPEGTIHSGGSMQQVKKGVALLALKTGVPVVPLAIRGSREAFPDGASVPRPVAIRMRFSSPTAYPRTVLHPIPEPQVAETLEAIRRRIVQAMSETGAPAGDVRFEGWVRRAQTAAAAMVILPLAGLLTRTANPSLDPSARTSSAA